MPKQEFPFPMPNGWFCVTRVDDIQNGESKPFTFCEKEVVAFRLNLAKFLSWMLIAAIPEST